MSLQSLENSIPSTNLAEEQQAILELDVLAEILLDYYEYKSRETHPEKPSAAFRLTKSPDVLS